MGAVITSILAMLAVGSPAQSTFATLTPPVPDMAKIDVCLIPDADPLHYHRMVIGEWSQLHRDWDKRDENAQPVNGYADVVRIGNVQVAYAEAALLPLVVFEDDQAIAILKPHEVAAWQCVPARGV